MRAKVFYLKNKKRAVKLSNLRNRMKNSFTFSITSEQTKTNCFFASVLADSSGASTNLREKCLESMPMKTLI